MQSVTQRGSLARFDLKMLGRKIANYSVEEEKKEGVVLCGVRKLHVSLSPVNFYSLLLKKKINSHKCTFNL